MAEYKRKVYKNVFEFTRHFILYIYYICKPLYIYLAHGCLLGFGRGGGGVSSNGIQETTLWPLVGSIGAKPLCGCVEELPCLPTPHRGRLPHEELPCLPTPHRADCPILPLPPPPHLLPHTLLLSRTSHFEWIRI